MSDACTVSKLHAWNTSNSAAHTHNYAHLCGCKHPEHRSNAVEIITVKTRPRTLSSQESGRTELQWLRQEQERNKQGGTKTHTHLVQTNAIGLMKDKIQSKSSCNHKTWPVCKNYSLYFKTAVCGIYNNVAHATLKTFILHSHLPKQVLADVSFGTCPPLPILLAHPSDTLPPLVSIIRHLLIFSPSIISPGCSKGCGTKGRETNFRIWSSPPSTPPQLFSHTHCNPDFL